ncbi:hypothetical protein, partial [Enterococcus faecium]|uniref:hypothetical protein n=1 Tax=Enterococcus faecium TaxID=1352 RepID=UPI001C548545
RGAHKGEVKPDSDASTWEFRLTNSARDNYGKACDDQRGAHKGEVKPDSDASTWEFRLTNSARDNYGKAC